MMICATSCDIRASAVDQCMLAFYESSDHLGVVARHKLLAHRHQSVSLLSRTTCSSANLCHGIDREQHCVCLWLLEYIVLAHYANVQVL